MKQEAFVLKNWINGKWFAGEKSMSVLNKWTGETLAELSVADDKEIALAVRSAEKAKSVMAAMPAHQRSKILLDVSEMILKHKESLAKRISEETGKALKYSRIEVDRSVSTLQISAEEAKRLSGEIVSMDAVAAGEKSLGYWKRVPVGVVLAITPFNFPLNLVIHKIGPAIAAGNTIILKPAENAPLSATCLAEFFKQAGLPDGVLNIIQGPGEKLGPKLLSKPEISKVTFTGSRDVGKEVVKTAGIKRVTLELGNSSPVIITETADLNVAAQKCAVGAFYNSGQVCISVQRIYIQEKVYERFLTEFIKSTEALEFGDPLKEDTDVGPMISYEAADRVMSWIASAEKSGAKIESGGKREGNLISPTIMSHCPETTKISCEEVFGPVAVVYPYSNLDEAINSANATDYGLQASIFCNEMDKVFQMIDALEYGGVIVNDGPNTRMDHMPYGGVKQSGIGREGPRFAIEEMTEKKMVVIRQG